jgi:hypothetical protein
MNVGVEIVGLVQRVDLETNAVENSLELRLPDGSSLQTPINEADAERILRLSVGVPAPVVPPQVESFSASEDDVHIFGGAPAEPKAQEVRPVSSSPALANSSVRSSLYVNKDGTTTPIRTISMIDEAGNPIIPGLSSFAEEAEPVDEDGVPAA